MAAERECPLTVHNGPNRQLFLTSTTTSHRVYELLLPQADSSASSPLARLLSVSLVLQIIVTLAK
jgi:hypothetical protein